ncbi:hypothetical protein D3OALGA1CA_5091 [Olavius algarvensis associated proteobacterium Delta 3]|nr:hypothetical protein D3OALGA1CA_5091 [Olavius algarvensis associated proteobacterium Delta 3]
MPKIPITFKTYQRPLFFGSKRKAGIVLILESGKDKKYWIRLLQTIEYYNLPIDTWRIGKAPF